MARLTFTSRSTGFFVGEAILVWGQRALRLGQQCACAGNALGIRFADCSSAPGLESSGGAWMIATVCGAASLEHSNQRTSSH